MSKEYRNIKKVKGFRGTSYDGELWIDGKFVRKVLLMEVDYRSNLLLWKLEENLDKETFEEVKEVMQLKYDDGWSEGYSEFSR